MTTLFFDYCLGKSLTGALRLLEPPSVEAYYFQEFFTQETPDDQWLQDIGQRGWIVITQDRKLHRSPTQLAAMKAHRVGCFYLSCANDTKWRTFLLLAKALEELLRMAAETPRPFAFSVHRDGKVARVSLDRRPPAATLAPDSVLPLSG